MATRYTDNSDSHLHFLITDPCWDGASQVVHANFTSLKSWTADKSCIIEPQEHPLITRRSVIAFQQSMVVDVSKLMEAEARCFISRKEPLSEELYEDILDAFSHSNHVPIRIKEMLRLQGLL